MVFMLLAEYFELLFKGDQTWGVQLFVPDCVGSAQKWCQVCQCIRHPCCVSEQFMEEVCQFRGAFPELLDHGFYSTCPGDL